ncbi:MAG: oligopeptide/dipeptide ABC transporter ATP-binding protein, partial [Burkholderiales bacterium]
LVELKSRLGLTMLYITHNLGVVRLIADHVAVMYLGRIIEMADTETLYTSPRHPYTRTLLSAVPQPDPRTRKPFALQPGEPPSPVAPPSGCGFRTRCPHAMAACAQQLPALEPVSGKHHVACLRSHDII